MLMIPEKTASQSLTGLRRAGCGGQLAAPRLSEPLSRFAPQRAHSSYFWPSSFHFQRQSCPSSKHLSGFLMCQSLARPRPPARVHTCSTLGIFSYVAGAYWRPIVLQMRVRAVCSRLVSELQRSPESASQVSGPRSLRRRPTSPTPALLDARRCHRGRIMSSTIGAEEIFCVATQPLADMNGSATYLGWGTTLQDHNVSR